MTFQEALEDIRSRIEQHGDQLDNEEITKHVLILPMLEAWGYDYRDPSEVRPEYPVKLPGGGSGRADYVIMHQGEPAIVIECKAATVIVDESVSDQMREYAAAIGAAIGVATNGFAYACYADIDTAGELDPDPFCFAVIQTLTSTDTAALELLNKASFASERIRKSARLHKHELENRWRAEGFLRGSAAQEEMLRIAEIRVESEREAELVELLGRLGERMRVAVEAIARHGSHSDANDEIETTGDEMDAYAIVKGILHGVVDPHRVDFRDLRTYASVLIDNNNRKPICRLHFNGRQKYLGTFDADKNETRHTIDGVNDIVAHAAALRRTARQYAES